MDIVIPTYGRANKQETARRLRKADVPFSLVVQSREAHLYSDWPDVRALPPEITTIAPTRQWIIENCNLKVCMLDDDLQFFVRREDDKSKLRDIKDAELVCMFERISVELDAYCHVGIAAREGANRNTEPFIENTRIMRVLAYDAAAVCELGIRFDTMEVMEDFHVALSLLSKGCPNLMLNSYANNQAGSGKEGGCSHFRTPELHAANAEKLAAAFPQFVTVVEKETKTAWGGGTRKDVRIQWKKAYEYGRGKIY
jgi:hypothetical protein